jgi:hypothetical protein
MVEVDYLKQARESLEKAKGDPEEFARWKKNYEELEKKKQALKEKFGLAKK